MSSGAAEARKPGLRATRIFTIRDSNRCTVPSRPSAATWRAVRKSLSHRRFWKGTRSRFREAASWASARAESAVGAIGLSRTTCSPASSAAVARGTWPALPVLMTATSCPPDQACSAEA